MMLRRFFQHGAVYLATIVVSRALDIVLLPVYTRLLGKADFGLMDLILFPVELVTMVVGLHLSEATGRMHHAAASREEQVGYATTGLVGEMAGHFLFALFVVVLAAPISTLLTGDAHHVFLVRMGVMAAVCRTLAMVVERQFRWELRSAGFACLRLAQAGLMNLAALLLIYCGWRAAGVVAGHALAGLLVGGAGLLVLRGSFSGAFSFAKWRHMAQFSVPLIPRQSSRSLTLFINRRILLHYHSLEVVGVYGMGARLALTLDIFMNAVSLALMPLILAHHDEADTPRQIATIFRYTIAVGLVGFVVYSLFAKEALLLFTTPDYLPAAAIVPLVFAGRFLFTLQVFAAGMWVRNRTRLIGLISVFGIFLDVFLNLALVPRHGMMGTAVATCVAGSACFVLAMLCSQRLYRVPFPWGRVALAAIACVGLVRIGGLPQLPPLTALAAKGGVVLAAVMLLPVCRLVTCAEIAEGVAWLARKRGTVAAPPGN